jgi:hypothetical protein
LPTWQAVVDRHYESWDRPHIVVDTARLGVDEQVAALAARLVEASGTACLRLRIDE